MEVYQTITIEAQLPNHTLDGEFFHYPQIKFSIGQTVYWKREDLPTEWRKYVIAGILLEQYFWERYEKPSPRQLMFQPTWVYVLADPDKWHHIDRPFGESFPGDDDLVTEQEYQQILVIYNPDSENFAQSYL